MTSLTVNKTMMGLRRQGMMRVPKLPFEGDWPNDGRVMVSRGGVWGSMGEYDVI